MINAVETMRLGDIVENPTYQVRMKIDSHTVARYAECMRLRHIFPPMVILKPSNEVLSGFMRKAAYARVFDPDYQVPVIFRRFKTEKEALLFAARENTSNGLQLGSWDRKNLIQRLLALKAPVKDISDALGRPVDSVKDIAGMTVTVIGDTPFKEAKAGDLDEKKRKMLEKARAKGKEQPVKAPFQHLIGKSLSTPKYEEIRDHQTAQSTAVLAGMIIRRLDMGIQDLENEYDMTALKILYRKLKKLF